MDLVEHKEGLISSTTAIEISSKVTDEIGLVEHSGSDLVEDTIDISSNMTVEISSNTRVDLVERNGVGLIEHDEG